MSEYPRKGKVMSNHSGEGRLNVIKSQTRLSQCQTNLQG